MAYVGTPIDTRNQFQSLQGKRFNGDGSTTDFTLDVAPSSTLDIEVFVGNVRQDPNSAYTVSGTTLSFTGAPPSGTNNIYVVHQAKSVGTINPPDDSVGANQLVDNSVGITQLNVSDGSNGQALTTNGSGTLAFSTVSADADNYFASSGLSSKDLGVGLHIKTADTSGSVSGDADELVIEGTGHNGMTILSGTAHEGRINFGDSGASNRGFFSYDHSADAAFIGTGGNNIRVKVASDGDVLIGKTSLALGTVGHQIQAVGVTSITRDSNNALILNREGSDGFILSIHNDESFEGGITFSGGTITYSTFVGSHWSRLADNSKPTILRGTVMESIATMCDWYEAVANVPEEKDGEGKVITPAHKVKEGIALPNGKSEGDAVTFTSNGKEFTGTYVKETNQQLPMCKISDTEDSKAVYGVFMDWDDQDDGLDGDVNDMNIGSLGAYVVRIHKDETVAIGDYLQSKGDGTAKKQSDDILRASTIAKVTSTEKTITHADGSYCVPCTLHCG
jgi:hypothetical protein